MSLNARCVCCRGVAFYSILLAPSVGGPGPQRFYIPNQHIRSDPDAEVYGEIQEVAFCQGCMRRIEDNLRATILYLQAEGGVVSVT